MANLVTASDCMIVQPREPPRLLQRLCRLASSCPLAAFIYLTGTHFHPNSGAEFYAFSKSRSQPALRSVLFLTTVESVRKDNAPSGVTRTTGITPVTQTGINDCITRHRDPHRGKLWLRGLPRGGPCSLLGRAPKPHCQRPKQLRGTRGILRSANILQPIVIIAGRL